MLPSQSKRYKNMGLKSDDITSVQPIADPSLAKNDSLTVEEQLLTHETPVAFDPENYETDNYWRRERVFLPANEDGDKGVWQTIEYCLKGFNDCGKSCPVANCERNQE